MNLPSPETIAKFSSVVAPPAKRSEFNKSEHEKKKRERFKKMGLTCKGTKRKNTFHESLRGITDKKEYMKAWHRLNPKKKVAKPA